jgi:hypothetical protein
MRIWRVLVRLIKASVFCAALALFVVEIGSARVIIDQEHFPPVTSFSSNVGLSGRVDHAQTFTAGVNGRIVGLDLRVRRQVSASLPLLYDIRTTINGLPTVGNDGPHILASGSVDPSVIPVVGTPDSIIHIDFATPSSPIVAGEKLAIVLRSLDPGNEDGLCYIWSGSRMGSYAAGEKYTYNNVHGWLSTINGADATFRTYMVPVPEFATVSLLFAFAFGFRRRRSQRSQSQTACV